MWRVHETCPTIVPAWKGIACLWLFALEMTDLQYQEYWNIGEKLWKNCDRQKRHKQGRSVSNATKTYIPHAPNSTLTLWRPLLPYGYSNKASCTRPVWVVICNFWHTGTVTLRAESQSAQMSKTINDGLNGDAENAGLENAGPWNLQGWKTQDWKTRYRICRGGKGRISMYGTRND